MSRSFKALLDSLKYEDMRTGKKQKAQLKDQQLFYYYCFRKQSFLINLIIKII